MTSSDTSPSVLQELYMGRARWDLLTPFPEQDPADRLVGDNAVALLTGLLHRRVDPEQVEAAGRLPGGLLAELQDCGLLRLMIEPALGGLGLSWPNACRVVEAAASWSMPVAFTLSIHNGFGSGSYLQVLPPGPLRSLIAERVVAGIVSAAADAEVTGAANQARTTVAVPVEDGRAYLLTGEKLFIGNGAVADFVDVSATLVNDDGSSAVRLFFVDTHSPGFEVVHTHEFMGLRGAPIGMLRLDGVRVAAERLMPESVDQDWRMRPDGSGSAAPDIDLGRLALLGRHLVIAPPSLAVARSALRWAREFVTRRSIDGRGLGEYEEIRRSVGETAAEVYAIESIQLWCLLGANTSPELTAAKNLTSLAAWRAIDRTMSLLGGEGYETARSKAARGAQPLPVERCLRDARSLRVAGGVDVMIDRWSAETNLTKCYYSSEPATGNPPWSEVRSDSHREYVEANAARLGQICHTLTRDMTSAELFSRQRTTALIGRIGGELLGMAIVLARSASHGTMDLADAACSAARRRLDGLWCELTAELTPTADDVAGRVGDRWLADAEPACLTSDVVTSLDAHTEIEATVAATWCELFGVAAVGPDDDFFALGGHSMLAVRMASRLRDDLGLRVPVRLIMENPTVAGLTLCLAGTGLSPSPKTEGNPGVRNLH
ncbi:alkylation response protein AidB-like acyl-CoA dehydrogenase/acyl carrier protein [Kibdelosporangium banguiense]|uniref:Alkylation response protein AidB-like acyl-CoA dehydrogenase/acyl carrier protein n=1 Tax=Kibdelosporangium banguiense TaxID=1365924 RepID=A0ABS4U2X9_9PSEU|nr:acyl-CoA dehydrogenase family protein [Kibdelosporangium banguiense]MBP2330545.1 alkylation response protein AidB-like acyl-CoA dehydrogenase/acyl carrier protein [Kibdelosporangium banguiense]